MRFRTTISLILVLSVVGLTYEIAAGRVLAPFFGTSKRRLTRCSSRSGPAGGAVNAWRDKVRTTAGSSTSGAATRTCDR